MFIAFCKHFRTRPNWVLRRLGSSGRPEGGSARVVRDVTVVQGHAGVAGRLGDVRSVPTVRLERGCRAGRPEGRPLRSGPSRSPSAHIRCRRGCRRALGLVWYVWSALEASSSLVAGRSRVRLTDLVHAPIGCSIWKGSTVAPSGSSGPPGAAQSGSGGVAGWSMVTLGSAGASGACLVPSYGRRHAHFVPSRLSKKKHV